MNENTNKNVLPSDYVMIPRHLIENLLFDDQVTRLYGIISIYADRGKFCESNEFLADKTGMTLKKIRRILDILVINKYLEIEIIHEEEKPTRNIWLSFKYINEIYKSNKNSQKEVTYD